MTRSTKSRAGNYVHLAIDGPSDSFSSRYDDMEDIDKCVLACDRALNDTNLNPKIRVQIRMAAHHGDHSRLAALFVQCERTTEQQTDAMQAFMASRVSGPPPLPAPSAADFVDHFFPTRPPLLTASALAELTTFTLPSLDFFLLYFCDV